MHARRIVMCAAIGVLLAAPPLYAQDSLAAARELYASAQYDEALSILERLSAGAAADADRQSIDLYRSLCLLAVGRRDEADRAIEAIVARNPLYRPDDDLPPRTRTAFSDVKQRVLPAIVQQRYAEAKTAFERRDFEAAAAAFRNVIDALDDPALSQAAAQPPLADLRMLAAGFHDLSVKSIPPPPPPPAPAPAPAPVAPQPPPVYTGDEEGIRPPVTVAQDMPRFPGSVPPAGLKGVIEIVIDQTGSVESAMMATPVAGSYDKTVLAAAQKWQFRPAMLNGVAVKFRKRIQINIAPPTS